MRHGQKFGREGETTESMRLRGVGCGFPWDEDGTEWDRIIEEQVLG